MSSLLTGFCRRAANAPARQPGSARARASAEGIEDPPRSGGCRRQPRQSEARLQRQSGVRSPLPSLRQKPANGSILMQIVIANVAANGNCPARKIPTIVIAYAPRKDFTGVDTLEIEIDVDNRTAVLSYRITVAARAQAQPL